MQFYKNYSGVIGLPPDTREGGWVVVGCQTEKVATLGCRGNDPVQGTVTDHSRNREMTLPSCSLYQLLNKFNRFGFVMASVLAPLV